MLDICAGKSLKEGNNVSIILEVDVLLNSTLKQTSRLVGLKRLIRSPLELFLGLESDNIIWATEATTPPSQSIGDCLDIGAALNIAVNNSLDQQLGEILAIGLREQLLIEHEELGVQPGEQLPPGDWTHAGDQMGLTGLE
ncbi:hypothetical protein HG530_005393 [Fusarium avenaceum]|nr:hypothetical protein HG530_005393 [Fusarium avenaceum]